MCFIVVVPRRHAIFVIVTSDSVIVLVVPLLASPNGACC